MYEGGVRSPTMVRWPQQIRPRTSQFAWAFWDMVPTVAELLGVTAPENDGISILPELYGQEQQEKKCGGSQPDRRGNMFTFCFGVFFRSVDPAIP